VLGPYKQKLVIWWPLSFPLASFSFSMFLLPSQPLLLPNFLVFGFALDSKRSKQTDIIWEWPFKKSQEEFDSSKQSRSLCYQLFVVFCVLLHCFFFVALPGFGLLQVGLVQPTSLGSCALSVSFTIQYSTTSCFLAWFCYTQFNSISHLKQTKCTHCKRGLNNGK
jgi:hypothetical protein